MPDIEGLSTEFGAPSVGGKHQAGAGAGAGAGGTGGTGTGGSTNPMGGASGGMEAGTHAGGSPDGGTPGNAGAGSGGVPEAGAGGTSGGAAGIGGVGGDGGVAGSGGSGGEGTGSLTCLDGCAVLYIPFTGAAQTQYYTVNLGKADFTDTIITAKVRATQVEGNATIMLYASAEPDYDYLGGTMQPSVSSIVDGATLTMDLTGTVPGWDKTQVLSFGLQIASASASGGAVTIEVEELRAEGSDYGPWLFERDAAALERNTYMPVEGSTVTWTGPR